MICIDQNNINKISENIFNNISKNKAKTLSSIQKCIVNQLGYKDWFSYQRYLKNNSINILSVLNSDEIINIISPYMTTDNDYYHNLKEIINNYKKNNIPLIDILKISNKNKYLIEDKRVNFLNYIEYNNFNFFDYKWFNYITDMKAQNRKIKLHSYLIFNISLSSYSIFNDKLYLDYFTDNLYFISESSFTVIDFLKRTFKSINEKDKIFRNYILDIMSEKYQIINLVSSNMTSFTKNKEICYPLTEQQIKNLSKRLLKEEKISVNYIKSQLLKFTVEQINLNNKTVSNIGTIPLELIVYNYPDISIEKKYKLIETIKEHKNNYNNLDYIDFIEQMDIPFLRNIREKNHILFKTEWLSEQSYVHEHPHLLSDTNNPDSIKYFMNTKISGNINYNLSWLTHKDFIYFINNFYYLLQRDIYLIDLIAYLSFMSNISQINHLVQLFIDIYKNPYSKEISDSFII